MHKIARSCLDSHDIKHLNTAASCNSCLMPRLVCSCGPTLRRSGSFLGTGSRCCMKSRGHAAKRNLVIKKERKITGCMFLSRD